MKKQRGVIALTTDFGAAGYHAGAMKGVILSLNPLAAVVDLCHGIPPGDVEEGAWTLFWNWNHFPVGTVHLAVVDPGVGSTRRPLAAAAGGHLFVGPDNGLLAPALAAAGEAKVVEIAVPREGEERISSTFHGRDIFAPAAARLSLGEALDRIGSAVTDLVGLSLPRPHLLEDGIVEGTVISIDPFGNLVSSITSGDLDEAGLGDRTRVVLGGTAIVGLKGHYAEGEAGSPLALVNSSGHLEVAVNGGRAADIIGAGKGDVVRLVRDTGVRP
jgi:S-adenosylmethionine hydrolase